MSSPSPETLGTCDIDTMNGGTNPDHLHPKSEMCINWRPSPEPTSGDFYEDDENPATVKAAFDVGEKGVTGPPFGAPVEPTKNVGNVPSPEPKEQAMDDDGRLHQYRTMRDDLERDRDIEVAVVKALRESANEHDRAVNDLNRRITHIWGVITDLENPRG